MTLMSIEITDYFNFDDDRMLQYLQSTVLPLDNWNSQVTKGNIDIIYISMLCSRK